MPWWSEPEAVVEARAALPEEAVAQADSSLPSAERRSRWFLGSDIRSSSEQEVVQVLTERHRRLRRFPQLAEVVEEQLERLPQDEAVDLAVAEATSMAQAEQEIHLRRLRPRGPMAETEISPAAAQRCWLAAVAAAVILLPVRMALPELLEATEETVRKA